MVKLSAELARRYELVRAVGKGGMGEVWLAKDLDRDGFVAIKSAKASTFGTQEAQLRFLREARITSALSHPNIIRVIDHGQDHGQLYIAFEYVEGGALDAYLREKGPLDPDTFFQMAVGILDAISYAHRAGVLHRDLKTANVLMDREMQPRIADFGLAKGIDDAGLQTTDGAMMGTPVYMAPELARGEKATAATDQYAVGVLLYQMLCAKPPLWADNPLDMLEKHLKEEPPLATFHRPEVPADLAAAVHRALAKKPEERWPDIAALRDAVNALAFTASDGWRAAAPARRPSRRIPVPPVEEAPPPPPPATKGRPTAPTPRISGPTPTGRVAAAAATPASTPSAPVAPAATPAWTPSAPVAPAAWTPSAPVSEPAGPTAAWVPSAAMVPGVTGEPAPAPAPAPRAGHPVLLAVVCVLAAVVGYGANAHRGAVSVRDLERGPVRGALGLPVGQVAVIAGRAIQTPGAEDKVSLSIESVDDAPLAAPVVVPFVPPVRPAMPALCSGMRFRLRGYETGGFTGTPAAWSVQFVVQGGAPGSP